MHPMNRGRQSARDARAYADRQRLAKYVPRVVPVPTQRLVIHYLKSGEKYAHVTLRISTTLKITKLCKLMDKTKVNQVIAIDVILLLDLYLIHKLSITAISDASGVGRIHFVRVLHSQGIAVRSSKVQSHLSKHTNGDINHVLKLLQL